MAVDAPTPPAALQATASRAGLGARLPFTPGIRRNLAWKGGSVVVEKLLRLGVIVLAMRLLGAEGWGRYSFALTWALLLVQGTDLGLALFIARETARTGRPDPQLIGEVLTLKGALSLLYLAAMAGLVWWHRDEPVVAAALAICTFAALGSSTLEAINHVFRGVQDLALEARANSFHAMLQFVIGCAVLAGAAVVWERGLTAGPGESGEAEILIAYALSTVAAACLALVWSGRLLLRVTRPRPGLSRANLVRFRREVLPLGIAIVASLIYYKVDIVMLRELRGDTETGLYAAGYKALELLAVVPSILLAATFPALSQALVRDRVESRRLHRTALRLLVIVGLAAAVPLAVIPHWLTAILGPRFAGTAPMLQALAPCVVLTFVNYLETHMLVALGLVRMQMLLSIALIGVNVAANLVLIPRYGGVGAAWATALTELALLAACLVLVHRGLNRAPLPPNLATSHAE